MFEKKIGEIRPNQLITTYGPGAIIDAVHDSLTVLDIEYWNENNIGREIFDSRLAAFGITDQASAAKELQTSQAFNLHNESYNQALHHAKLDSASSYKEMDQRKTTADNNTLSIQTRKSRTGANKYQRRQANSSATNRGKKK